jgi:Ca2+-binding RTX toxin-like protein
MIESLESRRLLAVSATLVAGNLTVTGDNDPNSVVIRRDDAGHILVRSSDATVGTFNNADVSKITVSLLGGNDRLEIASNIEKPSTVTGGDGNDSITSGSGQDNIHGNVGNDQLRGGNGKDALFGDDGSDFLDGGGQGDDLNGGAGLDSVSYAGRAAAVKVTLDNLANDGFQGNTTEPAEGDNVHSDIERISGGNGSDNLSGVGAPGPVTIEGGNGNDSITGGNFNDNLNGGNGNDLVHGGNGNDLVTGGAGNDNLNGDDGSDNLNGGDGADRMSGGGGIDQVSYADRLIGVNITLDGVANDGTPARAATATEPARPAEGDNVLGDVEKLIGSRGNDHIVANDAANTISGGQGNDYIDARGGNDIVEGGDGNDEIHGGTGNDKLYGGGGSDKLFGDDGNDYLYAKDGQADIVNGGGGTEDHAQRDEGLDTVTGVEIIIV